MKKYGLRYVRRGAEPATELAIEIHEDEQPLAYVICDPTDLSQIIRDLGVHRAGMADPIPDEVDPGTRIEAIIDPRWRLEVVPDGVVLLLRHPGLGWLGFLLPPHEVTGLGKGLLSRQA